MHTVVVADTCSRPFPLMKNLLKLFYVPPVVYPSTPLALYTIQTSKCVDNPLKKICDMRGKIQSQV